MAIVAADIKYRLSGGASNSDLSLSLGGAKSSTEVADSPSLHNLFDVVSGAELSAGDVEYRCVYIHNAHATLTAESMVVYINSNTPSADTAAAIGLGTAAINATEQTVANESTAPSGVTFSAAAGSGNALSIGNIPPGQHKSLWLRRTVTAGGAAYSSDVVQLALVFDTAP